MTSKEKLAKIEILEDVAEVEIGRVLSDQNYGNFRLSVRIATRATRLNRTIDDLRDYIEAKIEEWKLGFYEQ